MQNFSCLGWLKLLNYTFPGGRPAKPEINANLSPAWSAGAWAELGKNSRMNEGSLTDFVPVLPINVQQFIAS